MALDKSKAESRLVNLMIALTNAFVDPVLVMWAANLLHAGWGYWKCFAIAYAAAAVIASGVYYGARTALKRVRDEVD